MLAGGTFVTAAHDADAADLRIVMQTNTPSPVEGYRYTDVQSVTLGDTGDLAVASRVRKDNDEKRVLFRESGSTVVPVAIPGAPRPGGGAWDPLSFAPLVFHGQWLVFGTGDASGATTALFARGSTEASTQSVLTEAVGGFSASKNRQIVALAGGGIKGGCVHGATDEIGFHAVENRHYVTDLHATVLRLLGLDPHRLEIPGRKRLEIDFGRPIEAIIA